MKERGICGVVHRLDARGYDEEEGVLGERSGGVQCKACYLLMFG